MRCGPFYINYDREPERYADQHDFYQREVAPYLGEYDKLREVMVRVNAGVISAEQGRHEVKDNAAKIAEQRKLADEVKQGTRTDLQHRSNTPKFDSSKRDTSTVLRRLIRAKRDDLLAEIQAGTLSANAAAIAAGFRERMVSIPADPERRSIGAMPDVSIHLGSVADTTAEVVANTQAARELFAELFGVGAVSVTIPKSSVFTVSIAARRAGLVVW